MKLENLPAGAIDWSRVSASVVAGASGTATMRAQALGDMQLRRVDYSAGYVADHWCPKGHVVLVLSGALVIEHQDGARFTLGPGTSWHVGDDEGPPHRVVCEAGASVFIVD